MYTNCILMVRFTKKQLSLSQSVPWVMMEAVIGAIYLDCGFASAKEYIHRFILNDIEHKQLFYDSKTILQEIVQGRQDVYKRQLRENIAI